MVTGIHSYSFRDRFDKQPGFDIFSMLDESADMGFSAVEILTGKAGSPPEHIGSDTPLHLEKVINHALKHGISVTCFSTYNDFAYVKNEAWRLENIEYIMHWLTLAGEFGVPNIRMLTGYYIEGHDREQLEHLTIDGIRKCVPTAEKAGVNMAIENHNSLFFKGADLIALIDTIGSERLTTCPDPSNGYPVFSDDCTDETREEMYKNLELIAPRATNSHLKVADADLSAFDLDRIIGIYSKSGYDGAIQFEAIARPDLLEPMAAARQTLEDALVRNKAFSPTPVR